MDQAIAAAYAARGEVYAPLADVVWVEKAIKMAMQTIPKHKIVMGVATYGYEWEVTAYADGYTYDLLWSFNPAYAPPIAGALGITPARNGWGEMSFSYIPTTTVATFSPGSNAAAAALATAKSNNSNHKFRYMTWSDAESVRQKVDLAKRLGIRGVAVFKFDGGADLAMWSVLK